MDPMQCWGPILWISIIILIHQTANNRKWNGFVLLLDPFREKPGIPVSKNWFRFPKPSGLPYMEKQPGLKKQNPKNHSSKTPVGDNHHKTWAALCVICNIWYVIWDMWSKIPTPPTHAQTAKGDNRPPVFSKMNKHPDNYSINVLHNSKKLYFFTLHFSGRRKIND